MKSFFSSFFSILSTLCSLRCLHSLEKSIRILVFGIIFFEDGLLPSINTINNNFFLLLLFHLDLNVPVRFGEYRLKLFVVNCKLLFLRMISYGGAGYETSRLKEIRRILRILVRLITHRRDINLISRIF